MTNTTQPVFLDIAPWWQCPSWCDKGDNCYGGDAFDFGRGSHIVTSRHHGAPMLPAGTVTDIDGAITEVSVEVEAIEDHTDGYTDASVVTINIPLISVDADTAERLAKAILAAVATARQPLPITATGAAA